MPTILTASVFWPVVRACVVAAALALGACSTSRNYPELRDTPSAPANTTPQAERERIIKELEKERDNPGPARVPAVPPLPPKPPQSSSLETLVICDDSQGANPAVPALRGTLLGNSRPPASHWHPPAGMKAKHAPHKEGEGITGATGAGTATGAAPPVGDSTATEVAATGITAAAPAIRPDPRGALVLSFAAGAATLGAEDVAHLKEAVTDFVLQGGSMVQVRARGGAQAGGGVTHRPLASLSLGLSRATAIVNALIADGIGAERIKIAAQGDEDVPAVAAEDWNKAGPDGAIVIFQPTQPIQPSALPSP